MAKEDPLFQFYLEDLESPAKDNYAQWLMIELEQYIDYDDEVINIDLEYIIITYRRIVSYKGISYAFNYSIKYDNGDYSYEPDIDSVVRVYPKEITKIIHITTYIVFPVSGGITSLSLFFSPTGALPSASFLTILKV